MARVTFLNDNSAGDLREIADKHLASTISDFAFYRLYNHCQDDDDFWEQCKEEDDLEDAKWAIEKWNDLSLFHEYGLDLSFVEINEEDKFREEDEPIDWDLSYVRFQMSYGGPSDEIRLYEDGTIIYCFFDWFCGIGYDVTSDDAFDWLMDAFMVEDMFNQKREELCQY